MKLKTILFLLPVFIFSSCAYPYVNKNGHSQDERAVEEKKPLLATSEVAELTADQLEIAKLIFVDRFDYITSFLEEKKNRFQAALSPIFLIVFGKNPSDDLLSYLNVSSGLGIQFKPASQGIIVNPSNFFHVEDPATGKRTRYYGLGDFQKLNESTATVLVYNMASSLDGGEDKLTLIKVGSKWKVKKREHLVDY